jgi:hypothetical protein
MTGGDPFVSNYEFALAVVPAIAAGLAVIGMPGTGIAWLSVSMLYEMHMTQKLKTLKWGEEWGKWKNVIQHLYANSSRGFPSASGKVLAMWTSLNIVLNFYVLYRTNLNGIFFALWCYSFLVPATTWLARYNSGFPSASNYVEYRKDLIRPINLTIYALVLVNCFEWEKLPFFIVAIISTFGIEYLRRQVHYNNEFAAMLRHLEASNPVLGIIPFRKIVPNKNGIFTIQTSENLTREYDAITKDAELVEIAALAVFCATTRNRIRIRNIGLRDVKQLNFYSKNFVKAAQVYDPRRLPSCDDEDLAYIFLLHPIDGTSKRLAAQFAGWPDKEFADLKIKVDAMESLAAAQKTKIKTTITNFLSHRATSAEN